MEIVVWLILGAIGWSILKAIFMKSSRENTGVKTPISSIGPSVSTLAKYGIGQRRQSREYATIEKPQITLSPETTSVLKQFEYANKNFFLTGRAGTGKSTLLKYFRATTKKNVVVLAPTGVAAVNVQGQTIYSFCKFGPGITLDKVRRRYDKNSRMYQKIQTLIIDEISMVRSDLFDCLEKFLKLNGPHPGQSFGGVQIIAIGDLYQLPPVVKSGEKHIFESYYKSPFFFDALCYKSGQFTRIELTRVYRQSDPNFIEILDAIRLSEATDDHIAKINQRVITVEGAKPKEFSISLVTTNAMANEINLTELDKLRGQVKTYYGHVIGDLLEKDLPTVQSLNLKEGAQVMLLNNDPRGRWINGDLARVLKLNDNTIRVLFEDKTFDDVAPFTWEKVRFVFDEEKQKIESEVAGSFTQLPIKLAWAVTIHKGQGKTFDRAIIDFGNGTFAAGQAYVALSRCRSMEGLSLKMPLSAEHIFVDSRIVEFMKN